MFDSMLIFFVCKSDAFIKFSLLGWWLYYTIKMLHVGICHWIKLNLSTQNDLDLQEDTYILQGHRKGFTDAHSIVYVPFVFALEQKDSKLTLNQRP